MSEIMAYAESASLKDIMSTPLITIREKTTLQEALHTMRDSKIRKLPVVSKKNEVIGIIFQGTIANVIRDATATAPHLFSPPVKAILGNLGFVLQFAGVLLLVQIGIIFQGTIANVIRDATATAPHLFSPPVKAILGNLGFVLQFAGVLLLVPAILST